MNEAQTTAPTTDDVVRMAIEDLFPDQTIPDENNRRPGGGQYKAPDHSILGGKILIECKSRNIVDKSQFYKKLQEIASGQGQPFFGFGQTNLARIIEKMPDPAAAGQRMTDILLGQMMKAISDAKKKFDEHLRHSGSPDQIRVLIISDNTLIRESTDPAEYFLGRKMGGLDPAQDKTGLIDAIIYVKDPRYVLDDVDSYWFKCLTKMRLSEADDDLVGRLAASLHFRVARYCHFAGEVSRVRLGHYRPLKV